MVDLGAGRKKSTDTIDDRVTLEMLKAPGDACQTGEAWARIYKPRITDAEQKLATEVGLAAFKFSRAKPRPLKNILARM
jgi:thymidine phosphorylase